MHQGKVAPSDAHPFGAPTPPDAAYPPPPSYAQAGAPSSTSHMHNTQNVNNFQSTQFVTQQQPQSAMMQPNQPNVVVVTHGVSYTFFVMHVRCFNQFILCFGN